MDLQFPLSTTRSARTSDTLKEMLANQPSVVQDKDEKLHMTWKQDSMMHKQVRVFFKTAYCLMSTEVQIQCLP